jgi:ABC-type transport system involved in cytochrome bd biosynthesis fused ATPase/permease subunit
VNLDPYDDPKLTHRLFDDTLEDILARVGLQDIIKARGGLDASLKSMALSPGQKQLLCLARAILVREYTRSRIVLIDEATSNVDLETEKRLQSIMAKEFANCTVITVTHRDDGVEFADIVVEMADGRIIKTVDRRAKKDSQTKDFEDGGNAVAKPEMHNIEAQNKSEP